MKKNGNIVSFDKTKIFNSIKKAIDGSNTEKKLDCEQLTNLVISNLKEKSSGTIPNVIDVIDIILDLLKRNNANEAAEAFTKYLEKKEKKKVVVEVGESIDEYLHKIDWRINANANSGYSLGGMILNISGKLTANYWLSHVYTDEIGNLHRNADYHIHDLDMFCGYCAGWSLKDLLEQGFNGSDNRIDSSPAKNLQSAVNQMINFLGTLQNEWAGAQAFSSFDTYLSPFVHKYQKQIENELNLLKVKFSSKKEKESYIYKKTYEYVYQQMQNFVFGLNVPSRWGTQTPFTNITLDWTCPDDLKEKSLFLGGIDTGYYEKKFGELEEQMKIINRALIEVYTKGDSKGRVFTFPIPTYNITPDFPWQDPDIDLLFEMTAKYGLPYFQNFVGSQFKKIKNKDGTISKVKNPDAYTPGAVRSMCCRLQLDLTQLEKRGNGLFGSAEMTGSIGVVTLNMARLGYNFKGNKDGFKTRVGYLMDKAKESLEIKREVITKWLKKGLYPYTLRYLKSFRNHFSTIGLNGFNEAILNFTDGKYDISSDFGKEFSLEILDFMREKLKSYQEETGNLYNLEATPAEGTTYRFAKEDQKQIPDIIQSGTKQAPYYTNSTQLPVGYTDDAFEALDEQNDLQCKYTGGTVLHLYLGERLNSSESCKKFVKNVLDNYQLPYITISPTFSICPKHGYIVGEHDFCPTCDEEIAYKGEKFDLETRKIYTDDFDKLRKMEQIKI